MRWNDYYELRTSTRGLLQSHYNIQSRTTQYGHALHYNNQFARFRQLKFHRPQISIGIWFFFAAKTHLFTIAIIISRSVPTYRRTRFTYIRREYYKCTYDITIYSYATIGISNHVDAVIYYYSDSIRKRRIFMWTAFNRSSSLDATADHRDDGLLSFDTLLLRYALHGLRWMYIGPGKLYAYMLQLHDWLYTDTRFAVYIVPGQLMSYEMTGTI